MLKKKNLWRGLTMVFALLLAVSMMAGNILELYRTSVDAFLGTRSTQTVTEQSDDESDAWTYKSEFTTAKKPTRASRTSPSRLRRRPLPC